MKEKKMLEKCIGKIEMGRQKYQKHFFEKIFFGLLFYFYIYIEKIMLCIYGKDGESDIHISLRKKIYFSG